MTPRLLRYAAADEHAAFHRSIHDSPNDKTNPLVYADFLEEHGMPTVAAVIRQHVATAVHPVFPDIYNENNREDYHLEPGQFGVGSHVLRLRSAAEPGLTLKWHVRTTPGTENERGAINRDRSAVLEKLIAEGVKPTRDAQWQIATHPPPKDTSGTEYGHPDLLSRRGTPVRFARADEQARARRVDLITIPADVDGTRCGNCESFDRNAQFCRNPKVRLSVTARMCCFLPDSLIRGNWLAGSKAWYSGDAVEVRTVGGSHLRVTAKHPVLTEHGFVGAGSLKQGDNLIRDGVHVEIVGRDGVLTGDDVEQAPTTAEQIFSSLQAAVRSVKTPTSVDFHGDGEFIDGGVQVVCTHRFFCGAGDAAGADGGDQTGLAMTRLKERLLARQGDLLVGPPGVVVVGAPLGGTETRPPLAETGPHLLDATANRNPEFSQSLGDGGVADADTFAELSQTLPGKVLLDQIVGVERFHYEGPVYDFMTDTGFIIADGIYVSNCNLWNRPGTTRPEQGPVRKRRVVRYAQEYTHADFVRSIEENPKDATRALVYADWLDENGMPTFASIVRHHVERAGGQQGPHVWITNGGNRMFRGRQPFRPYAGTESVGNTGTHHLVYVDQHTRGDEPGKAYGHYFSQVVNSPEKRDDLLNRLAAEGVTTWRPPQQMSRRRVVRYAKVDGDVPAHPTVEGFPIEFALRHLANDPKNPDDIRDIAKVALTGGGYRREKVDGHPDKIHWHYPEGKPEALWGLHDALQEANHPAAKWYNWLSAADKLNLDQHTHRALTELSNEALRHRQPTHRLEQWAFTPEAHASRVHNALTGGVHQTPFGTPFVDTDRPLLDYVRRRVAQLAPGAKKKDIDESIIRHKHRADIVWRREHGVGNEGDRGRAIQDLTEHPAQTEEHRAIEAASRYARSPADALAFVHYPTVTPGRRLLVSYRPRLDADRTWRWHGPVDKGEYVNEAEVPPHALSDEDALEAGVGRGQEFTAEHAGRFLRKMRRVVRFAAAGGLDGRLVAAVLRPKGGAIDSAALGALGDHLQEIGSPLGMAVSHYVNGGMRSENFTSLSGDVADQVRTPDGQYQVIGRHGKDRNGKPIFWVSLSKWKSVPLPNGNNRLDKVDSHGFAVPAEVVKMSRRRYALPKIKSYFISPRGELHEVGDYGHESFAKGKGTDVAGLHSKGWGRVVGAGGMLTFDRGLDRSPPTTHQMRSLTDHAIENGYSHVWHGGTDRPLWSRPRGETPEAPGRMSRPRRYALPARGDFIDSLRRVRSAQQGALRKAAEQVAAKMGLRPASTVDALHDGPGGATPGVAQAVYGGSPEAVHAAAAWLGMIQNQSGMAVFHPRPTGPDALYRIRQAGSGLDIRAKLDRQGLTQRVLIPHRTGFDILIPDPGGRMAPLVADYARTHGIADVQTSRGHFRVMGNADRSKARAGFRDTVAGAARMERPRRYNREEDGSLTPEQEALARRAVETHDNTAWGALADHLQESGFPGAGAVITRATGDAPYGPRATEAGLAERHFTGDEGERRRAIYDRDYPPGTFRYRVFRDGSHLVHSVGMNVGGRHFHFWNRELPQRKMAREGVTA